MKPGGSRGIYFHNIFKPVRSFIHSFVHLFIRSFIQSINHSFIIYLFVYLFIYFGVGGGGGIKYFIHTCSKLMIMCLAFVNM